MLDIKRFLASQTFQPAFQPDLSFADYLAHPALGSTDIRLALDSMKAFHKKVVKGIGGKETPAMRLGKKIHHAVLEPSDFRSKYLVEPVFEGRTQKGELTTSLNCTEVKRAKAAWYSDIPNGSVVVTAEERDLIFDCVESILEHPQGADLFKNGRSEVSGFFKDEETGILLKLRADFLSHDNLSLVDLKSTESSDEYRFGSQTFKQRWDFQMGMYSSGIKAITGKLPELITLVAFEKESGECAVYYFESADLIQAESDFRKALLKIKKAIDENHFPMRQKEIQRIHTPMWFINRSLEQEGMEQ